MKNLALNQMELIEGGNCGGDLVGFGISSVGFVAAVVAVSIVTAPIGGWALLGFLATGAGFGYSGSQVLLNGNCI